MSDYKPNMIDDVASLRIKIINLELQNKELQKTSDYWENLVKEMADNMDRNAIEHFKSNES
jgi:hypothetical protein